MIKFIKRLLGRLTLTSSNTKEKEKEQDQEYLYNVWIPDGSGRTLRTNDPKEAELAKDGLYIRPDGHVACITCGGNCGQCGRTSRLGNIGVDMQKLVDNLNRKG